jgi:hypothetical protein
MSVPVYLYTLASIPMFASRPFLAAAMTALLAKFGTHAPLLSNSTVVQALSHAPAWFTSWPVVLALVALSVLEVLAVKHSEVRALMEEFDAYLKTAVAVIVSLALLDKESVETIRSIPHPAHEAGLGLSSLFAIVVGTLTFGAAKLRHGAVEILSHVDDHDDIGLQSALNWTENTWTVLGILYLAIAPVVALILSGLTVLGLWAFRRRAERREAMSKVPCAKCATPVFPHATRCPVCRTPLTSPRAVGVFGTAKSSPSKDPARQRFDLISRKRCPVCATRLKQRAVRQACPTCRTVTFESLAEFHDYLHVLQARLPMTLAICFGLSAIPVIGVIPGVIYYRLTLVSGLRGYVPPLRGCLARVMIRIVNWGLILLQPIPILGAFIVPLMCLASYWIYRSSLNGRAEKDIAAAGSLEAA